MDVLELAVPSGDSRSVVVRQYGPWHRDDDPHPGIVESVVLEHLSANGISAPELILGDEATRIMGAPAIVTSLVDGHSNLNPVDSESWVAQLVAAIAEVHSLPIHASLRTLIQPLYPRLEKSFSRPEPPAKVAQHPLGTDLWWAAKRLWPAVEKPTSSLVHGDYWAGNTLWKDEKLVAIVDWEEPRIGEPTFDIADLVQDAAFSGIDIEQTAIDRYERVSGRSLRDYKFWSMVVAIGAMPDPGEWAAGLHLMVGITITPEEVNLNLTSSVTRLLADS
jgi:aminoglycoside phosphotransferase (APT) family kinase protein